MFSSRKQTRVGQSLLTVEASWSHSFRHTTAWTSDRPFPTTDNSHKWQTFMPTVEFEIAVPESERLQKHVLDRAANGISSISFTAYKILRLLPLTITILLSVLRMNSELQIQYILFVFFFPIFMSQISIFGPFFTYIWVITFRSQWILILHL